MDKLLIFGKGTKSAIECYKALSKADRDTLDDFEKYLLVHAGRDRSSKAKTNAIRFITMAKKPIDKLDLGDLRDFLRILKTSELSDYSKNDMKGFVRRFLKWKFKDWSEKFEDFEDIIIDHGATRKKEIKSEDVLTEKDIENLLEREKNLFYQCFIRVQYKCGLRTKEVRELQWSQITKESESVWWLNVVSCKNRLGKEKTRTPEPLREKEIYYLNKLKKQQDLEGIETKYVFPAPNNPLNPISSETVSKWFRRLTKKTFNKHIPNYALRHACGERYHKAIRAGKMAKDNACYMMGHSEKMFDKTYSHADEKIRRERLKEQTGSIGELPPEKKQALEKKIEEQDEKIKEQDKRIKDLTEAVEVVVGLGVIRDSMKDIEFGKKK